ncbi:MAG: FtsX-like permease family protein, partial [Acidobacteriota bacterium]
FVVVRTSTEPASLTAQVREVMARLDPDLPIDRVRPMSAYLADGLAQTRLSLLLMSFFGASALLLSCVGIYGVFSYAVGQRTREIGIRMALGQEPWRIRNLVLAEGLRMIAISTGIGWFIAYAVTRVASTFLYQVHPGDPATFATMAAVLVSVALAGCYVPARRATRVNPMIALKAE